MSEPKSAAEIEDILSSIRRMVAQEPAPLRPFVLTGGTAAPATEVLPETAPESAPEAPEEEVSVRSIPADWPLSAFGRPEQALESAPAPLLLTPALQVKPPSRKIAAKVAPEPVPPEPVLPEMPSQSAEPPASALVLQLLSAEPPARPPLPPAPDPLAPDPLAWEAELGDPAPDLGSLAWTVLAEARRSAAPKPPSEAPAESVARPVAEPLTRLQEDDSIFSEDVLRELVRDLIKEQLQGELGERITRNIRRLVKAEISRATSVRLVEEGAPAAERMPLASNPD